MKQMPKLLAIQNYYNDNLLEKVTESFYEQVLRVIAPALARECIRHGIRPGDIWADSMEGEDGGNLWVKVEGLDDGLTRLVHHIDEQEYVIAGLVAMLSLPWYKYIWRKLRGQVDLPKLLFPHK